MLVAHPCNPSHSGGGDQEDLSSKPTQKTVRKTLSEKKNPPQERAGGENQGVGSEFKLQYHKKKLVQL
jgi:hypothetical protein